MYLQEDLILLGEKFVQLILDHPNWRKMNIVLGGLGHLEEQTITDFMRLIGQSIKCTKSLSM